MHRAGDRRPNGMSERSLLAKRFWYAWRTCIAHMYHKLLLALSQRISNEFRVCHRHDYRFQRLLLHFLVRSGSLVVGTVVRMRNKYVQVLYMRCIAIPLARALARVRSGTSQTYPTVGLASPV